MKTITPTPSQAAVVLQRFLKERGTPLKLGVAQDAIARVYGYADWNTLAADLPVRGDKGARGREPRKEGPATTEAQPATCHDCGSALQGEYCSNDDCRYADWPQHVLAEDLTVFDVEEIEERYQLKKRQSVEQTAAQRLQAYGRTLQKIRQGSGRAPEVGSCKACGSALDGLYCPDEHCSFHSWPQCVGLQEAEVCSQSTLERHYGIRKRKKNEVSPAPLTMAYFEERSPQTTQDDIEDLERVLRNELGNSGLLHGWSHQHGRSECFMEGGRDPLIQVSFDRELSDRFTTELVFTLRDHQLQCYVRTWEIRNHQNYAIFDEPSGDFDTDAERPDAMANVSVLVATALAEAELHRKRLIERVNVR